MQEEKTLKVYAKDSVFKFEGYLTQHLFEVSPERDLYVYERGCEGVEHVSAIFRAWDYILIEE